MLWLHFIYVQIKLFSSDIYMLMIYLFYVTQQTYICYCNPWHMLFKKFHDMHMLFFWSAVCLDPCHPTWYTSSQCHNRIIQVVWLGIMTMFQLRHHRETACHNQPSVTTIWQTGVGGGPHLTVALSAKHDMCQLTFYSRTYYPNSCQKSRADFCAFFCTLTQRSETISEVVCSNRTCVRAA